MSVEKLPIPPVVVDVVSDVVCPWCFIGKRRLEKALALKPEILVEVRFHPYFLNPWVPREGISRDEYLTTKFGSPDRYKGIAGRSFKRTFWLEQYVSVTGSSLDNGVLTIDFVQEVPEALKPRRIEINTKPAITVNQ